MNKNIFLGIGVVVIVGGLVLFFKPKGPITENSLTLKNEITVGQDICGEFPKEWVQSVINKTIIKTEKSEMSGLNVCQYYIDDNNFVTLRLNNLNFENQKKGQQTLGRTITTNNKIIPNHFIAVQGDNLISVIVLEINPNLFLAVDRSSTKAANETEIVDFAVKVAERIQRGENQGSVSTPTTVVTEKLVVTSVPLPQETDIVNNFFQLIDEGKASDAVMMMSSNITNDDSTKQGYGVQFAAMKSVNVKKIEESSKGDWTNSWHQYMVTFDVTMDPSSAGGPIPYYGYEKGENIRFINLVKQENLWKVEGIATGP